jgi:hypothetical protein
MALADKLFPVQKPPVMPLDSLEMPTAANAGRSVPPKLPPAPDGGKK